MEKISFRRTLTDVSHYGSEFGVLYFMSQNGELRLEMLLADQIVQGDILECFRDSGFLK